jgi:hypothetical protein
MSLREVVWGLVGTLVLTPAAPCADDKLPEAAQTILDKAEHLELLSLDPSPQSEKPKETFHEYKVLGKTAIKDAEVRKMLLAALNKGIKDANPNVSAGCFHPRHGIRATHDGKTVELVICFECISLQVFLGEKREGWPAVTRSPEATFDKVLREARVPLAPKPKDK